jgi:SpoVK/Ycf46/Vps4 family AAA+-type ATPase
MKQLEVTSTHFRLFIQVAANDSFRVVASLDRKCLGQKSVRESETSLRGIFDKETRRKPLAVAAYALSYGD